MRTKHAGKTRVGTVGTVVDPKAGARTLQNLIRRKGADAAGAKTGVGSQLARLCNPTPPGEVELKGFEGYYPYQQDESSFR